jgi:hypothetical protein
MTKPISGQMAEALRIIWDALHKHGLTVTYFLVDGERDNTIANDLAGLSEAARLNEDLLIFFASQGGWIPWLKLSPDLGCDMLADCSLVVDDALEAEGVYEKVDRIMGV